MSKPVNVDYLQVRENIYLVKTSAGFKKAIKHFCNSDKELMASVRTYPETYPSVIVVGIRYAGHSYIHCDCLPFELLNELIGKLYSLKG